MRSFLATAAIAASAAFSVPSVVLAQAKGSLKALPEFKYAS